MAHNACAGPLVTPGVQSLCVRACVRCVCTGASYALEETLCGDTICGTYGTEPSFDDDNRPPDGKTLGRCERGVILCVLDRTGMACTFADRCADTPPGLGLAQVTAMHLFLPLTHTHNMHRAGWTAMHTTAMYLPDTLSEVEQKSFVDLIHSTLLYPGNVSQIAFRGVGGCSR